MKLIDKLLLLKAYNAANDGGGEWPERRGPSAYCLSARRFCAENRLDYLQPTFEEALELRTARCRTEAGLPATV